MVQKCSHWRKTVEEGKALGEGMDAGDSKSALGVFHASYFSSQKGERKALYLLH